MNHLTLEAWARETPLNVISETTKAVDLRSLKQDANMRLIPVICEPSALNHLGEREPNKQHPPTNAGLGCRWLARNQGGNSGATCREKSWLG